MTLDSLLAIAGLLLAAYAIMPRARQLDLKLRIGAFDLCVAVVALLVVHYLQFHTYFQKWGLALNINYRGFGLTPEKISYVILLIAALLIGFHVCRVRLTPKRVPRFFSYAQELMWAAKYHDLALLLERHLGKLVQIYQRKTFWLCWRTRLLAHTDIRAVIWQKALSGEKFREPVWWKKCWDRCKVWAARCIPSREKEISQAQEFCIQVFTNRGFVTFLAKGRPYLGLDIIKEDSYQREEFLMLFMNALLQDTSSVLYHEIKNNQNLSGGNRYEMPEENRILHTLVADAKFAEKLEIYRPVGEHMIRTLDELAIEPKKDTYNLPMNDFHDVDKWTSSLWVGIRFFDIMVSTAHFAGIEWHMWLFYFVPITERICKNYRLDCEKVDVLAEWPTQYSYLLYEMFSAMTSWVSVLHHTPPGQTNVQLKSVSRNHENGNIPKSSILALSQCLKIVLVQTSIPEQFRQYLLSIVWRLYFDLLESTEHYDYAEVLRIVVVECANSEVQNREEYYRQLASSVDELDQVKHEREAIGDLAEFIAEKRGKIN